jgi:TRAP transporter TAXI family solute receptor
LAEEAQARGVRLAVLPTAGSVENITLLRQKTVELAFAQADVAALAVVGAGGFRAAGPYDGLRALLALFPEQLHVVVRADDRARQLAELTGRSVALGLAGSGTRVTAASVLDAANVAIVEPQNADTLDPRSALAALIAKEVDAVFLVGLAPFQPVAEAFGMASLRLLPIGNDVAGGLKGGGIIPLQIPAFAYSDQTMPVTTVAVPALQVVDARLTDAEASRIGEAVLRRVGAAERDPLALMVAPGTAGLGIAVPLHPAAAMLPSISTR